MTLPPLSILILRMLAERPRTTDGLRDALPATTAKAHVRRSTEKLAADGLICLKWGRWAPTRAGRRAIPAAEPLVPMRPYVPERRPPRRAGADHRHIPSLMAGRLVARR